MERADLLEANGAIFKPQGEALNAGAADDIKVLVVGNPANTNSLIARTHAPDIPAERFTAMTRLDENRAVAQLAPEARHQRRRDREPRRLGQPLPDDVPGPPQRDGRAARTPRAGRPGLVRERVPPARRQARRRDHRGARRLVGGVGGQRGDRPRPGLGARRRRHALHGRPGPTGGVYGIEEGLQCSLPVKVSGDGTYEIVEGLEITEFAQSKIDATVDELRGEREAVEKLDLV